METENIERIGQTENFLISSIPFPIIHVFPVVIMTIASYRLEAVNISVRIGFVGVFCYLCI